MFFLVIIRLTRVVVASNKNGKNIRTGKNGDQICSNQPKKLTATEQNPKEIDPESPIKILAGGKFRQRKGKTDVETNKVSEHKV
tara:strand:- start:68 stop:319 length:252 start_codon:yes stop_codon:yes gene_type:complete